MKVLELFAGTRSIGKAFEARGHEVFSVEWDKDFENIDLYADITTVTADDILRMFGKPDVIWASPDCTTYSVAAISKHRRREANGNLKPMIERKIARLEPGTIVRLGGMTDCFQPLERRERITKGTIELLNKYGIGYLIVTKSDLICEYMNILDRQLAHIQISVTFAPCEKAVSTERRIKAVETLHEAGFDVAIRLSPFVPQFVDFERLNSIKCNKIIVEFLRVNHWIKKWLPLDYSEYTVKQSGYQHLPLSRKIEYLSKVTGFDEVSVCEDVTEHFEYWREAVNFNKDDCCNLRRAESLGGNENPVKS